MSRKKISRNYCIYHIDTIESGDGRGYITVYLDFADVKDKKLRFDPIYINDHFDQKYEMVRTAVRKCCEIAIPETKDATIHMIDGILNIWGEIIHL